MKIGLDYRLSLMEVTLDFRLVRLHRAIRDITKHFPLHNMSELHKTASKLKFKDWPKNKCNNLDSMFLFLSHLLPYLGLGTWVLVGMKVWGWKWGGWKYRDESARMKVLGMKNRGWKWKDEISGDEVSHIQKCIVWFFLKNIYTFWNASYLAVKNFENLAPFFWEKLSWSEKYCRCILWFFLCLKH